MNERETHVEEGGSGRLGPAILAGLILVAVLAFVFQNRNTIRFQFLFFGFDAPLWLAIVVCTGGGFAAGWLLAWSRGRRSRRRR